MTNALSFLIDPLRAILEWIHATMGISWGWSIVVLTIMVRVVLIPLGVKQYTSMRAMQKLQPRIKELQKKYKGDKQKLNEETMKFYRENKVNPFGSCLPLLLQMPLFIALYYMLRNHPFESDYSWLWISNINDPDKIIVFLYIGSQFLSSRLLSTATDKTQQMMMTVMPLMFGVIFLIYPFPAGVLIYWVTTNVWTVGQQLVTRRIVESREVAGGVVEPAEDPQAGEGKRKKASAGKGKSSKQAEQGRKPKGRKPQGRKPAGKKARAAKPRENRPQGKRSGKKRTGGPKSGGKGGGKSGSKKQRR
jgi:YidC/Oxa1 family membrane protein insertase